MATSHRTKKQAIAPEPWRGKEQRGVSAARGSGLTIHGRLGNLEKSRAFFEIGVSRVTRVYARGTWRRGREERLPGMMAIIARSAALTFSESGKYSRTSGSKVIVPCRTM